MQHEILVAALGISGSLIVPPLLDDDDSSKAHNNKYYTEENDIPSIYRYRFECSPLARSLLSQSEIAAVNRFVEYGGYIAFLSQFSSEQYNQNSRTNYIPHGNDERKTNSLYLKALSSSIEDILNRYGGKICSLEQELIKDPSLGVSFLHGEMELHMRWIPKVMHLVLTIQTNLQYDINEERMISTTDYNPSPSIGKMILETIHSHLQSCGDENVRPVLENIQSECFQITLRQIGLWLERGEIVDPFEDFFIKLNHRRDPKHLHFHCSGYNHSSNVIDFDHPDDSVLLKVHRIPTSIISMVLAERILFIGKSVRVLIQYYSKNSIIDRPYGSTDQTNKNPHISTISDEISQMFHTVIDMHATLNDKKNHSDSIIMPSRNLPLLQILEHSIDAIYTNISNKLYDILLDNPVEQCKMSTSLSTPSPISFNLLYHLQNIRKAFLLGDGQLFTALCKECDSKQLWTKRSPYSAESNPLEFQVKALYPVMRHLYGWEGDRIHYNFGTLENDYDYTTNEHDAHGENGRLELSKRLSILTFSKSFIFQDFRGTIFPTLILGGLGARRDMKNGQIILSSPNDKRMDDKVSLGFVFTRVKYQISNGSKICIVFQFCPKHSNLELSNAIEKRGIISLVFSKENPSESIINALLNDTFSPETEHSKKPHKDKNTFIDIKLIQKMDDLENMRVTINDIGSKGFINVGHPGSLITITAMVEGGRVNVYLSFVTGNDKEVLENQNDFPPKNSFGILAASIENTCFSSNQSTQAFICVGAKSCSTKLLRWSTTSVDANENNVAIKLASELSSLSDDDISSLPPLHKTRLTLKKVQSSVQSKVSWLNGGGTIDENEVLPLRLYYSLPWPYHLIIQNKSIFIYNCIFNRMFAVQRASYEIHQCWKIMLQGKYRVLPNSDRLWLAPLWAIRTKMEFFLSNLLQYWKLDVAGSALHRLQSSIVSTKSFEVVHVAHTQYLGTLRRRCFFDSVRISDSLKKILMIVSRFTEVIRSVQSLGEIPSGEVNRLSKMFDLETAQLYITLQQSGALELCVRLDFNEWYSYLSARINSNER